MRKILMPVAALAILAVAFSAAMADHHEKDKDKKQTEGAAAASAKIGEAAPAFTLQDINGKIAQPGRLRRQDRRARVDQPGLPVRRPPLQARHDDQPRREEQGRRLARDRDRRHRRRRKPQDLRRQKEGISYPILLDPDGAAGKAYGAKTTPHMYIIDKDGKLAYMGGIDDQEIGEPNAPAKDGTVNYVDKALGELASGAAV